MRIVVTLLLFLFAVLNAEAVFTNGISVIDRLRTGSLDTFDGALPYALGFLILAGMFLISGYLHYARLRTTSYRLYIALAASLPYLFIRASQIAYDYGYTEASILEGMGYVVFGFAAVLGQGIVLVALANYIGRRE